MLTIDSLIAACKKNEAKAQMQLYDRYVAAMYAIAHTYVLRSDIAEDVVQEAFIKAFEKIKTYNNTASFGAWLKRIVINQAIDYLKKKKLDLVSMDSVDFNIVKEEDWNMSINLNIDIILEKINELPLKYKLVLQLFLLEGYDHQEISKILNISTVTSRSQLFRGKEKLKKLLNTSSYAK